MRLATGGCRGFLNARRSHTVVGSFGSPWMEASEMVNDLVHWILVDSWRRHFD